MKVKTFTGTHRFVVDRQVNEWRAKSNVAVRKTSVAFKALRYGGWDAVAGKTSKRRALAIAITVWYDEPYYQKPKPNPASTGALFLGRPMRVKTFTGTDRAAVDKQVSNWLTKSKVIVRKTDVASKALREWEPDATARRALAIAISIWYDEPYHQTPKPNAATWIFKSGR